MLGAIRKPSPLIRQLGGRTRLPCAVLPPSNASMTTLAADDDTCFSPVYTNAVSQTVLLHLQENRSDWLEQQGLDRGLHFNANGTFCLQFPAREGRIW